MTAVSVVIPTYNRRDLLLEAIRSVLEQTYGNREVIVVDDGSTDGTEEALRPFAGRIRYLPKQNGGASSARNLGIREARGELVAFLDSDDLWEPRFLEVTAGHLRLHPEQVLVSTAWRTLPGGRRFPPLREPMLQGDLFALLMSLRVVRTSAVLARKDILLGGGAFDESLEMAEDLDLWLRLARAHPIAFLNVPLSWGRKHPLSLSRDRPRHLELQLRVLERHHDPARVPRKAYARRRSGLHLSLGRSLLKAGRREEALTSLRRAVALDPWSFAAYRSLLKAALARAVGRRE